MRKLSWECVRALFWAACSLYRDWSKACYRDAVEGPLYISDGKRRWRSSIAVEEATSALRGYSDQETKAYWFRKSAGETA